MPSPIRVLHILEGAIGGAKKHVLQIVRGLERSEFQQGVIFSARRDPRVRWEFLDLERESVWVSERRMQRRIAPLADVRSFFQLVCDIRRFHPHIVHTHCAKAGWLGRFAARAAGVRSVVHTPHALPFGRGLPWLFERVYLLLERVAACAGDAIVCLTPSQRAIARASHLGCRSRLVLIPNGIESIFFAPACAENVARLRERFALRAEDFVLGAAGRLTHQKGFDTLLRAVARVRHVVPSLRLLIAGRGEERAALDSLRHELGLRKIVQLVGTQNDMRSFYELLDLFILPSRWEGLPYTLLEAMATARPPVASNVCGARDLIRHGENGWLFPVGDEDALADSLIEAIHCRNLRAVGDAARATVAQEYRVERMIQQVADLYRQLLSERSRAQERPPR